MTATASTTVRPLPFAQQLRVLGVRIDNLTQSEAVAAILQGSNQGRCQIVNFANAHCLNTAETHTVYRHALASSDLVLADGSGVKLATELQRRELKANLNGTDLFPLICEAASQSQQSIFLLGARPGIADAVASNMQARFPELQIAGTQDGYFSPDQEEAVIDAINASGADILFVAMGVPQQELWLHRVASRLQVRSALGVGGLFDFYSGRISRAPLWLRRVGMEWCWRLAMEPQRMWRRYVLGNPLFVCRHVVQQLVDEAFARSPLFIRLQRRLSRLRCWKAHQAKHWQGRLIRLVDILVSGAALIALSPLMAIVALLIRLESPGSVLFGQTRIGEHGQPFQFWKFRSMYTDAEARRQQLMSENEMAGGVLFKIKRDPRITRVGRVIRRFSIDELPQLWNVLCGDMALVGPRPPLPDEVALYKAADRQRLAGKPGITCVWQVSGRSDIPFDKQVKMDVGYLHKASLITNFRLLIKTIPAVLSGRGAY